MENHKEKRMKDGKEIAETTMTKAEAKEMFGNGENTLQANEPALSMKWLKFYRQAQSRFGDFFIAYI